MSVNANRNFTLQSLLVVIVVAVLAVNKVFADDIPLTVIYSGNLDGELEPCGCSEQGNLGGIKRRTTMLDQIRNQDPNVVVISSGGLITSEGVNDYLKSVYIFKAFAQLNYDAIAVQWKDLSFGANMATADRLSWVASNWIGSDFAKSSLIHRRINNQDIVMQFFSWLDPENSPVRQMPGAKPLTRENFALLNENLTQAKQSKRLIILAVSLPLDAIGDKINLANVDILIVKSGYEVYDQPMMQGTTLVLKPGSRGMRLGKLELVLSENNTIKQWSHATIDMPTTVKDAPRMQRWYKEYNDKVKQDYLKRVAIRKQRESGNSPYVGEEQCKVCHAAQYQTWQASEHAKAYEDLENVQKSFDPECLACHTVGFNQPGGFVDFTITSHLSSVQCENCHGAAKQHVQSAGKQPVANHDWPRDKMCAQCHIQKHSPGFILDQYWPKIAH